MRKAFICIFMMLALGMNNSSAQNVVQKGNTFTEVAKPKAKRASSDSTKTSYVFTDTKGKTFPIYLTSRGKAYIRTSQKEGAKGRKYLPEVGKKINPKAYIK